MFSGSSAQLICAIIPKGRPSAPRGASTPVGRYGTPPNFEAVTGSGASGTLVVMRSTGFCAPAFTSWITARICSRIRTGVFIASPCGRLFLLVVFSLTAQQYCCLAQYPACWQGASQAFFGTPQEASCLMCSSRCFSSATTRKEPLRNHGLLTVRG